MKKYKIISGKDLKQGMIIIHNYRSFLIIDCGPGSGAGSLEFGEYVWVKAMCLDNRVQEDFWACENCPVVVETS
jgi:hypothetical protein